MNEDRQPGAGPMETSRNANWMSLANFLAACLAEPFDHNLENDHSNIASLRFKTILIINDSSIWFL